MTINNPHYVPARTTSGLAVASLILSIFGLLTAFCAFGVPSMVAVLLGHMAMSETKTGKRGGHGIAVAGLMLGYVVAVPALLLSIYYRQAVEGR